MAKEMAEYGIDVLAISQTRWKGMGSATLQSGETVVYVGDDEMQKGGLAIVMRPISKRIIKARFYSRHKNTKK